MPMPEGVDVEGADIVIWMTDTAPMIAPITKEGEQVFRNNLKVPNEYKEAVLQLEPYKFFRTIPEHITIAIIDHDRKVGFIIPSTLQ